MLRIFLTGDNHIGMEYGRYEDAGEKIARKRLTAFEGMVAKANEERCDLFVIAGDLFDRTSGIGKRMIRELLGYLDGFSGKVVVLPGNHDYYDGDAKIWQDFEEELPGHPNIQLLTGPEPAELELGDRTAVLYPAICPRKHSAPGENSLGWIKKKVIVPDEKYRIGLAHGAIEGETPDMDGIYYLMTKRELEDIPVDVWLIGHTHVPVPRDLTEEYREKGKIFNAGTHVQRDVYNNTEGLCFVIEIGDDKKVRAKKTVTGNIRFREIPVKVTAGQMREQLERALRDLDDENVVELVVSGAVTDEEYRESRRIEKELMNRFLSGWCTDSELSRQITGDVIDREFPETSLAAGLLKSLLGQDEPKEAQLVYEMLKEIRGGKKK